MGQTFLRITEIVFASYMVPALLIPPVWGLAWMLQRRAGSGTPPAVEVESLWRVLLVLFVLWLTLFIAVLAGVPLNRGGAVAIATCWGMYALTNLFLAWSLLRFTARYGSIPVGPVADRAFLRFLAMVVAQPLMTAAAFAVLNQVMGVAWNLQVPELPAIQEGI